MALPAIWLGIALLTLAAMAAAYLASERDGLAQIDDMAYRQLDLYASTLENELGKHAYLPSLIEIDRDVAAVFDRPGDEQTRERVNRKLSSLNVRAGSIAIALMGLDGRVLASSDGYKSAQASALQPPLPPAFLPRLTGPQQQQQSQFFVAHPESGASEYYFAQPFSRSRVPLGTILVKISLDPLEATWIDLGVRSDSDAVLVVDGNGVVIMSSVPGWKFRTLALLSPQELQEVDELPQYPAQSVRPLSMTVEKIIARGASLVRLPATQGLPQTVSRVIQERPMAQLGWRLVIVSDPGEVWRNAWYAAWGGGAITAFICLLAMHLLQRRRAMQQLFLARNALQAVNGHLEAMVEQRTGELRQVNQNLLDEMKVRHLAEQELVQTGKLAVLGQMSAGVAHEINQPLTALRALSENTAILLHKGRLPEALSNLKAISEVAKRMGRITEQLKSFARKGQVVRRTVVLEQAISNVQLLLEHRTRAEQVRMVIDIGTDTLPQLYCDGVRLEQVLINLCTNALDAMASVTDKVLRIRAWPHNGRMLIGVADTGPAIPDEVMQHLFEPFFSTKSAGAGLGLGLVISSNIVREFGSDLRVRRGDVGLVFEFDVELGQGGRHV